MCEELNRKEFHEAIDTTLSGLQADPWLAQRVVNRERTSEPVVKKKLSFILVLVIVLILITVTALAISLLSGKRFIEDTLAPQSTISDEKVWTPEEIEEIRRQIKEQGIVITPEIETKLMTINPVYKEELMRSFMKMDLGYYPASWPLEEQAWYDELLVELGLKDERTHFLPENNEISENRALEIARGYILQKWNIDVKDNEQYVLRIQYILTTNENNNYVKRWDITYEGTFNNVSYVISLTPEGHIIDQDCYAVNIEASEEKKDQPVDSNANVMILMWQDDFYTVESLATLSEQFGNQIMSLNNNWEETKVLKAMLNNSYTLPDENDISPEDAITKAKEIAQKNGWTEEQLALCRQAISYRKYPGELPYYRICFKLKDGQENRALFYQGEMPFGIVIYLNPLSGEVIRIQILQQLDDFERYPEFPDPHDTVQNKGIG